MKDRVKVSVSLDTYEILSDIFESYLRDRKSVVDSLLKARLKAEDSFELRDFDRVIGMIQRDYSNISWFYARLNHAFFSCEE